MGSADRPFVARGGTGVPSTMSIQVPGHGGGRGDGRLLDGHGAGPPRP